MVRLAAKLPSKKARIILQIHDELVIEAPEPESRDVAELLTQIMEHPLPDGILDIPLTVKVFVASLSCVFISLLWGGHF